MGGTDTRPVKASHDPVRVALAAMSNQRKSGTIIEGPIGSGKTFALRAVVQEIGNSQMVSSRTQVVEASGCRKRDVRALLASGTAEKQTRSVRPFVLASDDLDTWDPAAFTLLADAMDSGQVRLLGTVRSSALADVMSRLRPALPAAITSLEPWRLPDLSRHARVLLDAPLHPMTAQRLLKFAGGNPLCLAELLEYGRSTSRLHRRYETWVWSGPVEVPPVTLTRIWGQLHRESQAVRDVLISLGSTGPLALRLLQKVHPLSVLEEAEAAGLVVVQVHSGTDIEVELARPIDGQVALSTESTLRRRVLGARLVAAVSAQRDDRHRYATTAAKLCLTFALPLPEPLQRIAAANAARGHEPQLVRDLVNARLADRSDAAGLEVSALVDEGRFGEAAEMLARGIIGEAPRSADELSVRRRDAYADMATGSDSHPGPDDQLVSSSTLSTTYSIAANSWHGRALEPSLAAGQRLLDAGLPDADHHRCLVALMLILVQRGMVEQAVQLTRSVDAVALERFAPAHRVGYLAVLGLCHLVRGDVNEAQAVSSLLCSTAVAEGWPLAHGFGSLIAGRCALLQARPRLALRRLSESLASFEQAAPTFSRSLLLQSLGLSYLMAGRPADTQAVLRQAEREVSSPSPFIVRLLAQLAHAELLYFRGERHAALDVATNASRASPPEEDGLGALLALHVMSRIQGTSTGVQILERVADRADFHLAGTYVEHARALQARDPKVLEQIAEVYDGLGLYWLAAETAAAALTIRRGESDSTRPTGRLRRFISKLQDEEEVALPAWWGSAVTSVPQLTEREQEIAAAAVNGMTSAQIAGRLSISRRTVENHLQHVFRKLGISGREELARSFTPRLHLDGRIGPRAT